MGVNENMFVQLSGTMLDGAVLAGSHGVQMVVLCGMSGTQAIPVMVTGSGEMVTKTI